MTTVSRLVLLVAIVLGAVGESSITHGMVARTADHGPTWPLSQLLIRFSDLRPGYENSYLQCQGNSCNGAFQTRQQVSVSGGTHVSSLIGERMPNVSAAIRQYQNDVSDPSPRYRPVALPRVGEQSTGYVESYTVGSDWQGYYSVFRRGRYVVHITLYHTPLSSGPLLSLAQLVDQRIMQHG